MLMDSGGGTVDFQEFVGGLSAFSSRGGREEKLRCQLGPFSFNPLILFVYSRFQCLRRRQGRLHLKRRTLPRTQDDGRKQSKGTTIPPSYAVQNPH
jgi:hypothetical protein